MRQGQQNRRGRGRGSNSSNNNRKAQNPLSRSYESSGPDVKIRGTASQIAEKYATLARDASSSGDTIMAENYLQHAEHYNRIIMSAQGQNAQPSAHNGSESSHAMNGAHRNAREGNGMAADQPQPHIEAHPSPNARKASQSDSEQPTEEQPASASDDQPAPEQRPARSPRKAKAPAKDAAKEKEAADGKEASDGDGRRRRRRYPGGNGSGASDSKSADGEAEKSANVSAEDQSSDEATAS